MSDFARYRLDRNSPATTPVKQSHTQTRTRSTGPLPARSSIIDRIVVIDDYSMARGGATTLSLLSAKLFRGLDIPVTYICGDSGINPELSGLGVSIVALGSADLMNARRSKAFVDGIHNAAALRQISDWIAANDTPATAYHVHGWSKILSPAIFSALSPVAGRCVVHAHDFFTACPNGAFFDYQAQQVCFRRPLGLSCVSTACDKRHYAHKLWRVARGVNIARLLRDKAQFGRIVLLHEKMADFFDHAGYQAKRLTTIRNPVAMSAGERVKVEENDEFVFIGRLDEEKGVEDAVAATRQAGAKLCIIGDGPLMTKVAASGDHVRMVGWQSHAEMAVTIRQARALLMPSRYPEPFGLVAVEAAGNGIPVIMSQHAFLAEEMESGGIAASCDTTDIQAFADLLTAFLAKPGKEIREMSEQAVALAPSLANTHEEWRDALLCEYQRLISAHVMAGQTDRVTIQGARS